MAVYLSACPRGPQPQVVGAGDPAGKAAAASPPLAGADQQPGGSSAPEDAGSDGGNSGGSGGLAGISSSTWIIVGVAAAGVLAAGGRARVGDACWWRAGTLHLACIAPAAPACPVLLWHAPAAGFLHPAHVLLRPPRVALALWCLCRRCRRRRQHKPPVDPELGNSKWGPVKPVKPAARPPPPKPQQQQFMVSGAATAAPSPPAAAQQQAQWAPPPAAPQPQPQQQQLHAGPAAQGWSFAYKVSALRTVAVLEPLSVHPLATNSNCALLLTLLLAPRIVPPRLTHSLPLPTRLRPPPSPPLLRLGGQEPAHICHRGHPKRRRADARAGHRCLGGGGTDGRRAALGGVPHVE